MYLIYTYIVLTELQRTCNQNWMIGQSNQIINNADLFNKTPKYILHEKSWTYSYSVESGGYYTALVPGARLRGGGWGGWPSVVG